MPFLVLLALAFSCGLATAFLARHPLRHPGRVRAQRPTLHAARQLGEHAGQHRRIRAALAARLDPERATGLALTLALLVIVVGGIVLGALTALVLSTNGLISIDRSVANWGDRHATAISTDGLTAVTRLGETWLVLIVGVLVAWIDHRRSTSLWAGPFLLAAVAGEKILVAGLKDLVDRVRPALNPIAETLGPSFPSGHTATAATFWAAVALVAGRWYGPRGRTVLAGFAVGTAVAVASSRVLLDVHWLTDVLGGLVIGWAWFAACAIAFGGRLLRFAAATEVAQHVAERAAQDDLGADRRPDHRAAGSSSGS